MRTRWFPEARLNAKRTPCVGALWYGHRSRYHLRVAALLSAPDGSGPQSAFDVTDSLSHMSANTVQRLDDLITQCTIPPFVYCYPPRSAYRTLDSRWTARGIWERDLIRSGSDLNLYIHVPFCGYKCGFCNLYTVIAKERSLFDAYTAALCEQLLQNREIIARRNLRTVYIGGGTPSLLSPANFDALLATLTLIYPNWRATVEELCVEATPDSLASPEGRGIGRYLIESGFTRINLGVQSMRREELRDAGRVRADETVVREAIALLSSCGLANLSVDLIMGFAGQTDASWAESVRELVSLAPQTVSTYFLTVRPDAWFSKTGRYTYAREGTLYNRYDVARSLLLESGYIQESNVRYKIPGRGGYRQKVLQFRGIPVLGIGAGARSYTNTVDYLVGGGAKPDLRQIHDYMRAVERGETRFTSGFVYDDDERLRKRLVLDLFDIDVSDLCEDGLPEDVQSVLDAGVGRGLLQRVGNSRYQLTSCGYKYRDILSWLLFSSRVIALDEEFYMGLHAGNVRVRQRLNPPGQSLSAR